jgi:hypothetical protein
MMPLVDHCPKCARTRVNGWCPGLCCEQVEGVILTEAKPDKFHGILTQELYDEISRRGILSR